MKKKHISLAVSLLFLAYGCTVKTPDSFSEPGFSDQLAAMRADQIANVNYLLYVSMPENQSAKIDASLVLEFFMGEVSQPVILDFHPDESHLLAVFHKGEALKYSYTNGHIIIDKKHFEAGQQQLEFHFTIPKTSLLAGENYLMINPLGQADFLAFPAFNQTDLPASFLLNMEIPANSKALSNAQILKETEVSGRLSVAFAKTPLISVDEFSFVVGRLSKVEYNTETKSPDFYFAGNTIPDSTRLAQFAAEFVGHDTLSDSQFGFSRKTDLVLLADLELQETLYLPGLIYVGNY